MTKERSAMWLSVARQVEGSRKTDAGDVIWKKIIIN